MMSGRIRSSPTLIKVCTDYCKWNYSNPYSRGPVVIVGGGRLKMNEFAVGAVVGTGLVGGVMTATDALVRCSFPSPTSPVMFDILIAATNME